MPKTEFDVKKRKSEKKSQEMVVLLKIIFLHTSDRFRRMSTVIFIFWPLVKGGFHKAFTTVNTTNELIHLDLLTVCSSFAAGELNIETNLT